MNFSLLYPIVCLSSILYTSTALAQMPFEVDHFHWGEVEIISLDRENINKTEFLKDSPFILDQHHQVTEEDIEENFTYCEEDLKKKLFPKNVDYAIDVNHENKLVHLVIALSNTMPIDVPHSNAKKMVLLEPKLIQLHDNFGKKWMASWGTNRDLTMLSRKSDQNQYYLGYVDTEFDQEAARLFKIVAPHKKHIFDVINYSDNKEDIHIAARLLNWVGLTAVDMNWMLDQLSNGGSTLSEKILQLSILFPILSNKEAELKLFNNAQQLVLSPDHEIRSNSLKALCTLLERDPALMVNIDTNTKKSIKYLAENSILHKVKTPAQEIISLLEKNKGMG